MALGSRVFRSSGLAVEIPVGQGLLCTGLCGTSSRQEGSLARWLSRASCGRVPAPRRCGCLAVTAWLSLSGVYCLAEQGEEGEGP